MLTIAEMRARAGAFARDWRGETREAAERQTFWNEWFEVFGIHRRRFVTFERNVKKLSGTTGQIDAFWPGMLLIEHKSAGEDLDAALEQAEGYLLGLREEELPRLIVLSDFARFRVLNLETRDEVEFSLDEFPERIELFTFLAASLRSGLQKGRARAPQKQIGTQAGADRRFGVVWARRGASCGGHWAASEQQKASRDLRLAFGLLRG